MLETSKDYRTAVLQALLEQPGVGNGTLKRWLEKSHTMEGLLHIAEEEYLCDIEAVKRRARVLYERGLFDETLDCFSADYPQAFKKLCQPPGVIYAKGDKSLLKRCGVALVGTRKPDAQALDYTRALARIMAENGYVIVSGLAQGIDQAAHQGAMDVNGATIAILGERIDDVCERNRNREYQILCRYIQTSGLFLTEQTPFADTPKRMSATGALMARNRLIAALSCATVVVAAKPSGGAICTADHAEMLRKPLFTPAWEDQRYGGNLSLLLGGAFELPQNARDAALVLIESLGRSCCFASRNRANLVNRLQ